MDLSPTLAHPPSPADPWPAAWPRHLTVPGTNLYDNLLVSARRYPDKPAILFYDTAIGYRELVDDAERLAGYLEQVCGVRAGDRVLLYMQNSPQWIVAFYGILRANAVVVPVNPMNRTEELRHCLQDSAATVVVAAQDLCDQLLPLCASPSNAAPLCRHLIVATYSDGLRAPTELPVPPAIAQSRQRVDAPAAAAWCDVLAMALRAQPLTQGSDDLCVLPYTSGTTGAPKGCMHTHRSVMATVVGGVQWFARTQDSVFLSVLPFFHVTGLVGSMNGPIYAGATIVLLPRWDREAAARCVQRYRVDTWQAISTMVVDFLANPRLGEHDLSSLRVVRGGGAAMPQAVAQRLHQLTGQHYVEGYGMSETMAATHINPMHRPKPQCLGIAVFDVDARLIDPHTAQPTAPGETGEIAVRGPQVMRGYWGNPAATEAAFIELDGQRYLRTGDLARVDEEGYFFMVDRVKRMINASGYKVWPAEVEALLYHHPAILEACVIGVADAKRGETVKALVVLKPDLEERVSEQQIVEWAHAHMAAYKSPRLVEIVPALPKSGTGKVLWRELQDRERAR